MAIWRASLTIRDEQGKTRVSSLHLNNDASESEAEIVQFMQAYAALVDTLITGAIVDINLTQVVPLPGGIKTTALASSDVEEGALFVWLTTEGLPVQQRIPTFAEDFILPGTDQVDRADPDVSDFVQITVAPIELPEEWSVFPSDSRGVGLQDVSSAKESFKP